jgi:histone-lysine N-methyltransferase SETMAR
MKQIFTKFVLRLLTSEQEQRYLFVCQELLDKDRDNQNFLLRVITQDKTWVHCYDRETSSSLSGTAHPLIVHLEFVPPGQTVNQQYYWEVLQHLKEPVHRKSQEQWRNQDWFIHHDIALACTALSVQQFLVAKNMALLPHPPYAPDLAPCDFFLFPRMKLQLKECCFRDVFQNFGLSGASSSGRNTRSIA